MENNEKNMIQSISRSASITDILVQLRDNIIKRKYESNMKLPENVLAENFGVSRGSIRTALQVLENEGLVGTLSNGRKFVIGFTDQDVNDYYDLRCSLECMAAKAIVSSNEYVDFSYLAKVMNEFHEIENHPQVQLQESRAEVNAKFHRTLMNMSGNRALIQCWNSIETVIIALAKINSSALDPATHERDYVNEHNKILEYIITKDKALIDYVCQHVNVEARNTTYQGLRHYKESEE